MKLGSRPHLATALLLSATVSALPTNQKNVTIPSHGELPIVDLGYELHQAIAFNQSGSYYNFSNIRYAAPPVGKRRWAAPQHPASNRSSIQTGNVARSCPTAFPFWELTAISFIPTYLEGGTFSGRAAGASAASSNASASASSSKSSAPSQAVLDAAELQEDCLFLDVFVPKKIFNADGDHGAPVLVWIYGGGYVAGSKTNSGDPAGLIHRSNDGIIVVALNYRLGAFGWLSGPTFQKDGVANAGLHDQRFALEWVKKHISDFGGDPNRVTVMGESAGGGSILHQITSYGGRGGKLPFDQAIIQSPGFLPIVSNKQQEQTFTDFLSILNVSTLAEARQLSSDAVINANSVQVATASYGSFVYGPVVDGDFVPALPGVSLLHGDFHKNVKVMVGHNADEGLLFTSPYIKTDVDLENAIKLSLPDISNDTLTYVVNTLYPPVYDSSSGYKDITARAASIEADLGFICNTYYLDTAFKGQTYSYKFDIFPGIHGQDVDYTFYNDGGLSPIDIADADFGVQSVTAALTLQDWIVTFTANCEPSAPSVPGTPDFHVWGPNAFALELTVNGTNIIKDDVANPRCAWWQEALYV